MSKRKNKFNRHYDSYSKVHVNAFYKNGKFYNSENGTEVKLEDGTSFKIGAVAKGAGMINPNLATMLCFVCTDANVPNEDMKEALEINSHSTFNAISFDTINE